MKVTASGYLVGFLALILSSSPLSAQEAKSSALAAQLTAALDAGKLGAIAAPDPSQKDVFVAALHFPGAQLLVVSAKYPAPQLITERIAQKDYKEVYLDLQSAAPAAGKVFVHDAAGDGLKPKTFDSVESDGRSVSFDGDWKKMKLSSEGEYQKALSAAEERYSQMLSVLLAQAKKGV